MGTRRNWNRPGDAHFWTYSTHNAVPVFTDTACASAMVTELVTSRKELQFRLFAYVVMPEHVHMIIRSPEAAYVMEGIMHKLKRSTSGRVFKELRSRNHPFLDRLSHSRKDGRKEPRLWLRGGGYDKNLRGEDAILGAIEYIHLNPVRRGICRFANEYPWSSARPYFQQDRDILDFYHDSL